MAYLSSKNVVVYPTAYRGQTTDPADPSKKKVYNPESILNTEANITRVGSNLISHSNGFVITNPVGFNVATMPIEFIIHGYYFKLKPNSIDLSVGDDIYAHIALSDLNPITYEQDTNNIYYPGTSLVNILDEDETLDVPIIGSDNVEFTALWIDENVDLKDSQGNAIHLSDSTHYVIHLLHKESGNWIIPEDAKIKFDLKDICSDNSTPNTRNILNYLKMSDGHIELESQNNPYISVKNDDDNLFTFQTGGDSKGLYCKTDGKIELKSSDNLFIEAFTEDKGVDVTVSATNGTAELLGNTAKITGIGPVEINAAGAGSDVWMHADHEIYLETGPATAWDASHNPTEYSNNGYIYFKSGAAFDENKWLEFNAVPQTGYVCYGLANVNSKLTLTASYQGWVIDKILEFVYPNYNSTSGWNLSTKVYGGQEITNYLKVTGKKGGNQSDKDYSASFSGDIEADIVHATAVWATDGKSRFADIDCIGITARGTVGAASFNATSDKRLKENILEYKPEKSILDLPIYKYDFIKGKKNQIGCLAQDLQQICPEIVEENNEGYLSIQESKLIYLLLNEVKKLKEEIEELKK